MALLFLQIQKLAIRNHYVTNAIVANKVSIVDPECMMTMPKKVLASVGFDALCHSIEAYTSKIAQPFTDVSKLICDGTDRRKPCQSI